MENMNYNMLLARAVERGFNQKALAERIGVSEGHFCQKINGRYSFKQKEIRALCEVLEIDPGEIGLYFFTSKVAK